MTSNVGAKSLLKDTSLGFKPIGESSEEKAQGQYDRMKEKVLDQLKTQFRPEFLNRVDSLVVFRSLTIEEIGQIVDLMLARVREQLRAQEMQLEVTQAAKEHIIRLGYDADYGARPLRRVDPEHDRGPAGGGAADRPLPGGPDGRRRSGGGSRADDRAARGEDARRPPLSHALRAPAGWPAASRAR